MIVPPAAVPAAVVDVIFTSLAFLVVLSRIYTRAAIVKNAGVDDYLIVVSMCGSIAYLITIFIQMKYGLGRVLSLQQLPDFLRALWTTIPLYNFALSFCKLSIAAQYYRVFRTPAVQRMLLAVMCVLVVYGLWAFLGNVFTCFPVQKYWDFTIREGACLNRNTITYINAGGNIASDLTLLSIPIPLLKNLQLPKRQKYILVGVFLCGTLACVMSIIRLKSLYEIGHAPPAKQSVQGVSIAIWSCIEINVGIICASVPALKPLVTQVFPKIVLSDFYSRSKNSHGRYVQHSSGIDNPGQGGSAATRSDVSASKRPGIIVQQTFEMNAMPAASAPEPEALSNDGSENNLVQNGRRTDCYASPSKADRV